MARVKVLCLILVWSLTATVVWGAASAEEARRLYEVGRLAEAREELLEVMALETRPEVRAQALGLLALIALDEDDLELATEVWRKLIADYPDSPEAQEASSRLAASGKAPQPAAPNKERPVPSKETPPEIETRPTEEAPGPPSVEPPPAPVPALRGDAPAAQNPMLVLVAGRGKPYDGVQEASNRILEYLVSAGVRAETATRGIPVVEESTLVQPALLHALQDKGGTSLLLITANFVSIQKIILECYSPEGALIWKEKIQGGTGVTGRPYSKTGINQTLVERILEKLAKRVGGPGLPVAE
jgi:hypothetical protein